MPPPLSRPLPSRSPSSSHARPACGDDFFRATPKPSIASNCVRAVAGAIMSTDFTEGALVKAGDVLFKIDPAPYAER